MLLVVVAGVYAGSHFLKNTPPSFERLTYRRGDVSGARFSPDGQTVVFSAQWNNEPIAIFSMRPGSRESRHLDLPAGRILSISSSGEMAILLGAGASLSAGTLARVALSGGAPREILDDVNDADWSPDGTKLAVSRTVEVRYRIEYPIGNVLSESEGRPPMPVRVSPKGDQIAFFEYDTEVGDFAVTIMDLHGRKRVLSRGWAAAAGLGWSPKGDEIWFGGTRTGGEPALRAVNLQGNERILMETIAWPALHDITRDGRVLVAADDSRVGISGFASGAQRELDLSRLETSLIYDISSDGKTVLFVELSYGQPRNTAIYLRQTDGSAAVRLGDGNHPMLSPDGKWVACILNEGSGSALLLLPTAAGESRRISTNGMHYERVEWFPDGRHLMFNGNEPNHRVSAFMQSTSGGEPVPITPEGTTAGQVSPDQKYVTVGAAGKLSLCSIAGGALEADRGSRAR